MKRIEDIIQQQHNFFKTLKSHDYYFRRQQLTLLYQNIYKYQKEIEQALYQDLKKPAFEAYATEIGFVLNSIRYMKKHLKKWMKPQKKLAPYYLFGTYDTISYQPLGISLIIGPFNYPFQLVIEPLIGAIAAGNCAVVKPSENAPATAKIIKKIIDETFFEQYIYCVLGDVNTTVLLTHCQIDHIFFTGSIEVGKEVMRVASEQLIPVTLELGGKSPVIIDESALLKDAVEKIAWGKILNAGQTCVAPDYLIINKNLKDEFIRLWQITIKKFLSQDDYARIINKRHFKRLVDLLENEQIYDGGNYNSEDLWIEPTLVNGNNSKFMDEEIFGPILPIITYQDEKEIVEIVERHPFPLALYIFSKDKQYIDFLTKRLLFGGACINDCISHLISPKTPFGGVRYSGIGQYHGKDSFISFSHKQAIHHRILKREIISLYPPYSKLLYTIVKKVLK